MTADRFQTRRPKRTARGCARRCADVVRRRPLLRGVAPSERLHVEKKASTKSRCLLLVLRPLGGNACPIEHFCEVYLAFLIAISIIFARHSYHSSQTPRIERRRTCGDRGEKRAREQKRHGAVLRRPSERKADRRRRPQHVGRGFSARRSRAVLIRRGRSLELCGRAQYRMHRSPGRRALRQASNARHVRRRGGKGPPRLCIRIFLRKRARIDAAPCFPFREGSGIARS